MKPSGKKFELFFFVIFNQNWANRDKNLVQILNSELLSIHGIILWCYNAQMNDMTDMSIFCIMQNEKIYISHKGVTFYLLICIQVNCQICSTLICQLPGLTAIALPYLSQLYLHDNGLKSFLFHIFFFYLVLRYGGTMVLKDDIFHIPGGMLTKRGTPYNQFPISFDFHFGG